MNREEYFALLGRINAEYPQGEDAGQREELLRSLVTVWRIANPLLAVPSFYLLPEAVLSVSRDLSGEFVLADVMDAIARKHPDLAASRRKVSQCLHRLTKRGEIIHSSGRGRGKKYRAPSRVE